MDIIFMNFGNSNTSNPHGLLLNLSDKINLKRSDKYIPISNLSIYSPDVEWKFWINWCVIFCIKYLRFLLIYL